MDFFKGAGFFLIGLSIAKGSFELMRIFGLKDQAMWLLGIVAVTCLITIVVSAVGSEKLMQMGHNPYFYLLFASAALLTYLMGIGMAFAN